MKKMVGAMELIEVIYSVLIYGGAVVFLIMLISFLISKSRNEKNQMSPILEPASLKVNLTKTNENYHVRNSSVHKTNSSLQQEQNEIRIKQNHPLAQIFQIDQKKQREIKIVRKPTFHTANERSREKDDLDDGANLRYTIVNDEIRKVKNQAMNFYL